MLINMICHPETGQWLLDVRNAMSIKLDGRTFGVLRPKRVKLEERITGR